MFYNTSSSSSSTASSPSSSSSSSSRSSPIHHASLVDPATHNPALLDLVELKVNRQVIEYVVDCVVETVDFAMGRPSPSSTRGRSASRRPEHAKFTNFVQTVLSRAEVTMPTLLATLVFVDRAKPHLHIALEEWALERVFLGALIVASKYLNDSTLKNVHWALCTGVFGKRDVGRIEREYLDVLNFELSLSESDLLAHHHGLASIIPLPHHHRNTSSAAAAPAYHAPHSPSTSIPELDPSSPVSSSHSHSSSPATPPALEYPMDVDEEKRRKTVKKPTFHSTTMDLLKAFPFPSAQVAYRSHKRSRQATATA